MKAKFIAADPTGRFQFHSADGTEVVVDSSGFTTDDPVLVAFLDNTASVKRASKKDD